MGVLDAAKVCDSVAFVVNSDGMDAAGDRLLSAVLMQGQNHRFCEHAFLARLDRNSFFQVAIECLQNEVKVQS